MPNTTDTSATDAIRTLSLERLAWARAFTEALAASLSDDQLVHRAGGKGNHAMWVLGHMATTDDFFLGLFSGQPRHLEHWDAIFGGGSEPKNALADYPPRAKVEQEFRDARARLTAWWSKASEADLTKPLEGDVAKFAPDALSAIVSEAAHEFFHAGQIASCRAALGLPRLMA